MKITMYKLLGMVKDGKAPKKIIYDECVYELNKDIETYEREIDPLITIDWEYIVMNCLNNEVEILEEKEIPEELPTWFSLEKDCENDNIQYANYNFERMYGKINEICDYLKSKGDE